MDGDACPLKMRKIAQKLEIWGFHGISTKTDGFTLGYAVCTDGSMLIVTWFNVRNSISRWTVGTAHLCPNSRGYSLAKMAGWYFLIFMWLVVTGAWLDYFPIYWEESSHLTNSYFSEGFKPPIRIQFNYFPSKRNLQLRLGSSLPIFQCGDCCFLLAFVR